MIYSLALQDALTPTRQNEAHGRLSHPIERCDQPASSSYQKTPGVQIVKLDRRDFVTKAGGVAVAAAAGIPILTGATRAAAADKGAVTTSPGKVELKYAFSVAVFFKERIFIDSTRSRGFVPAQGGEVWGPRLKGRVVPYGGADYASNGFYAHYMLEASDGALIYIQNRGYVKRLDGLSLVIPRPARKPDEPIDQQVRTAVDPDAPARFRITPIFDAPVGPHEWLSRTLFVGHGRRYVNPDHTIFTYYEVL
jgi:hypothetical protein